MARYPDAKVGSAAWLDMHRRADVAQQLANARNSCGKERELVLQKLLGLGFRNEAAAMRYLKSRRLPVTEVEPKIEWVDLTR